MFVGDSHWPGCMQVRRAHRYCDFGLSERGWPLGFIGELGQNTPAVGSDYRSMHSHAGRSYTSGLFGLSKRGRPLGVIGE